MIQTEKDFLNRSYDILIVYRSVIRMEFNQLTGQVEFELFFFVCIKKSCIKTYYSSIYSDKQSTARTIHSHCL